MRLDEMIPVEAQEMLIASGFSMMRPEVALDERLDLMDIDAELNLLGNRQIADHLTSYTVDDKIRFKIGNDPVKLVITGKKIQVKLGSCYLVGAKKGIVLNQVLKHSVIVDSMADDQWLMYTVVFNGRPYRIGRMRDVPAWFMSKVTIKAMTSTDYYKVWKQRRTQASYKQLGQMQTDHEVYGSAEASLGSIFTDQVEDEMLEAIQTILKYKDTYIGSQLTADLLDTLGVYDEDE